MTTTTGTTTTRGAAPAGPYAAGERSPVAYVRLCPPCGGYEPMSPEDYRGALSGICQGCGGSHRELHRFPALIDSARRCACLTSHGRVTGDVDPVGYPGTSERQALVIAALDEAAADRDECARDARRHDRIDEQREHNGRAAEYRAERDQREAGRNAG